DSPTIRGALITKKNDNLTTDFKIQVLNRLMCTYARASFDMANWPKRWYEFEDYKHNGIQVFATLAWNQAKVEDPAPFPTDTVAYKIRLDSILDEYQPLMVVVENEETDIYKHLGPIINYLYELNAAMTVVHEHGLMGTNGGLSIRPLTFLVYRWYYNKGHLDTANAFARLCVPDRNLYDLQHPGANPGFEQKLARWDSLVKGYRFIPIDYVNIHFYEPVKYRGEDNATALSDSITTATPFALKAITHYLMAVTGKKTISNEMGQLNYLPALVTSMLDTCNAVKMKYVIWYSGDGGLDKSFALHTPGGYLRENGKAFRDYVFP
ncbi:MAG: hypothetical protein ABJA79_11755, partial [Parafilimonas sp.]